MSIYAKIFGDFEQFYDVEPTLAAFVLGDEGLGLAELLGQLGLGQPYFLAALGQQVAQFGLLF